MCMCVCICMPPCVCVLYLCICVYISVYAWLSVFIYFYECANMHMYMCDWLCKCNICCEFYKSQGKYAITSLFHIGVGMVLEWEQMTGLLYASGDVRHIRVWDVHKELMMQDIPTKADSSVTCLTSDSAERSLLIAGCGDGTVRLYDRRQHPNSR